MVSYELVASGMDAGKYRKVTYFVGGMEVSKSEYGRHSTGRAKRVSAPAHASYWEARGAPQGLGKEVVGEQTTAGGYVFSSAQQQAKGKAIYGDFRPKPKTETRYVPRAKGGYVEVRKDARGAFVTPIIDKQRGDTIQYQTSGTGYELYSSEKDKTTGTTTEYIITDEQGRKVKVSSGVKGALEEGGYFDKPKTEQAKEAVKQTWMRSMFGKGGGEAKYIAPFVQKYLPKKTAEQFYEKRRKKKSFLDLISPEASMKMDKLFAGASYYTYEKVRTKPFSFGVEVASYAVIGAIFPPAAAAARAVTAARLARFGSLATKIGTKAITAGELGIGALYAKEKVVQFGAAPDLYAKGGVLAQTGIELSAFGIGSRTTRFTTTRLTGRTKVYEGISTQPKEARLKTLEVLDITLKTKPTIKPTAFKYPNIPKEPQPVIKETLTKFDTRVYGTGAQAPQMKIEPYKFRPRSDIDVAVKQQLQALDYAKMRFEETGVTSALRRKGTEIGYDYPEFKMEWTSIFPEKVTKRFPFLERIQIGRVAPPEAHIFFKGKGVSGAISFSSWEQLVTHPFYTGKKVKTPEGIELIPLYEQAIRKGLAWRPKDVGDYFQIMRNLFKEEQIGFKYRPLSKIAAETKEARFWELFPRESGKYKDTVPQFSFRADLGFLEKGKAEKIIKPRARTYTKDIAEYKYPFAKTYPARYTPYKTPYAYPKGYGYAKPYEYGKYEPVLKPYAKPYKYKIGYKTPYKTSYAYKPTPYKYPSPYKYAYPYKYPKPTTPPPPPIKLKLGLKQLKLGKKKKLVVGVKRYSPDLYAIYTKWTAKQKPIKLTGIGARPIIK